MSPFTEPEPPTRVHVNDISNDTAVVCWTASQSRMCDIAIVNYSVKYQLWNSTGNYTTVNTSNTSVTLQDLLPNTMYNVSVAAISSVGNISEFSTIQFTTSSGELTAM